MTVHLTGVRCGVSSRPTPARPKDEAAVKEAVRILDAVYSEGRDPQKYRSLLTEDYLLLENGRSPARWRRVALLHSTVVVKAGE